MSRLLSKNNRVLLVIALMAASSFAVGGLVYAITSAQAGDLATTTARLTAARGIEAQLAGAVTSQEGAVDDFVLSRAPIAFQRYTDAVTSEDALTTRMAAASVDLPDVSTSFEVMEASSREWRQNVAEPVITALGAADQPGIDRFSAQVGDDHAEVDSAIEHVTAALTRADVVVDRQRDAVAGVATVGTALAFAFLLMAFGVAIVAVRKSSKALEFDARQASVLNRFTEVTTFAEEDRQVAFANLVALGRLTFPDASVTHILNRSLDRAVPEASTGDAIAEVLPLRALDHCAGVLRGTMFVSDDLSDDLSVRCPVYPAVIGTLACIPLASGESVGAVHLYWQRPNALPLVRRPSISRITEHTALTIGNRRLLAALHGQANTDPRTGLANSRAFDLAVESALTARSAHETVSVLMLDVDHFKGFNDRHGHPAGDEALRAFGGVLRSCMREGDLAARYGGEEFAVLLPQNDSAAVAQIAERIRQRIEATIISVAPGVTDHITVSIGIANAPEHGTDRVTLLRLADEALYEAKATGRNRVVAIGDRRGRVSIEPAVKSTGRRHRSPDVGDDLPMVGATG